MEKQTEAYGEAPQEPLKEVHIGDPGETIKNKFLEEILERMEKIEKQVEELRR